MTRKALFIIPSLGLGGGERALVTVLRHLDRSRFRPTVAVFNADNVFKDDIPGDVEIVSLDRRGDHDNARLVLAMSRLMKKTAPDVICTLQFRTHYLAYMARRLSGLKAPLFFSEQSNLSMDIRGGRLEFVKRFLIKRFYPASERVICVSKGVQADLLENWGVPEGKTAVIHNPVEVGRIESLSREQVTHPWFDRGLPVIVACGRLVPQKNYPLLLKAFAAVSRRMKEMRLMVIGEGYLRPSLEAAAKGLGMEGKVDFLGFQQNPFRFMARSRAVVMSSSWEGLPTVIMEAFACGVPVVSTRCPSGPEELITDGVNGLLTPVDDEAALAEAVLRITSDEQLRRRLAASARLRAQDFSAERITCEYERLFEGALPG